MTHICKSNQNCLFREYKREYTFADTTEAGEALRRFLAALNAADSTVYPLAYRDALAYQCRTVLASLESVQMPILLDNEAYEWLITTIGVALVRAEYDLGSADAEVGWGSGCCPCDCKIERLVSSEGPYSMSVAAAAELLGEPAEAVAALLWDLPCWYYTGAPEHPTDVRLSMNAVLYLTGVHVDYETPWVVPHPRATKVGFRLR